MRRRALLASAFGLLAGWGAGAATAEPSIIHVNAGAAGANDGSSWTSAFTRLQNALAVATSGDQVWVAKGVYYPDQMTAGPEVVDTNARSSSFTLVNGVNVYGGFDPAGGADTFDERDPVANVTVLSGNITQNDTVDANGIVLDWEGIQGNDNAYHVVLVPAAVVGAVLDGFTITGGAGDESDPSGTNGWGGGLYSAGTNLILNHVVFRGNKSFSQDPPLNGRQLGGGGAMFYHSTQTLTDVKFIGNCSCQGGGSYSLGGNSTYRSVVFEANDAWGRSGGCIGLARAGGGLEVAAGTATVENAQFTSNTASDVGGGLDTSVPITLTNATFVGNSGSAFGDEGCSVLTDVTFTNNTGGAGGGAQGKCASAGTYKRVTFTGNHADNGGGLWVHGPINVIDALFAGNEASGASGRGGAIYIDYAVVDTVKLTNSVLRGNRAGNTDHEGGGAIFGYSGCANLINSTVTGNSGGALWWFGYSPNCHWVLKNSIVWGNTNAGGTNVAVNGDNLYSDFSYSIIEPDYTRWGPACPGWAVCDHVSWNTDPVFVTDVDPSSAPTTAGDVHLQSTSPAMDAGNNDLLPVDAFDVDDDGNTTEILPYDLHGSARRLEGPVADTGDGTPPIVDIGAYEYTAGVIPTVDLQSSQNPSTVGQTVTLTASVTHLSGTPTGTVTFRDGAGILSGCADLILSGGSQTCAVSTFTSGTHALSVRYSGDATYQWSSDTLDQVVHETGGSTPQTITFNNPGAQNFGTSPTLTATATSGLAVVFSSSTPGVCTVSGGGALQFVTTGTCVINADQPGNASFLAAPTVTQSFSVNPVVPGAPTIGTATAGDTQATVAFTAPAFTGGAAITGYTATSNPGGLTGTAASSPITVTGLTNGTAYTFTVHAQNSVGYGPPSSPSNSVTPSASQTITFNNPGAQNFGTSPTLTATATSGLTVVFSSSTSGVCTVSSGGALHFVTTGTCVINADQPGNASFLAAPTVTQSFSVNPVVPGAPTIGTATAGDTQATVAFTAPAFTGGAAITGYTATSNPGGLTGTAASSPITVTGLTNGTAYRFTVHAQNSMGYGSASAESNSVTPLGSQTITFGSLAGKTYGDAPFAVSATAGSGLPVSFEVTAGQCDIANVGSVWNVTINGAGACTVMATQSGNYAWLAATPVSQSFAIAKADAACTVNGWSGAYDNNPHGATGSCTGVNGDTFPGTHGGLRASRTASPLGTPTASLNLGPTFTNVNVDSPYYWTADWYFTGGSNYNDRSGSVHVDILAKDITVTANPQTKVRGQAFTFAGTEFSHSSLVGSDDIDSVTLTSDGAASGAAASTYAIVPSDAIFSVGLSSNYFITYVNGTMTVTEVVPSILTVTADNKTVEYGDPNPTFTLAYSGWNGSDGPSALTTQPTCGTTRTALDPPNTYSIACSGGVDDFYSFSYVNGTLTVNQETATLDYTGDTQVTAPKGGGSVTVTMSATIEEQQDGTLGSELAGQQLEFLVFADNELTNLITSCTATVGDVSSGMGSASCTVDLSAAEAPYWVKVSLLGNDYYTAEFVLALVLVNQPGSGSASGAGWLVDPNVSSRGSFGFNVKFARNGRVQGSSIYSYTLSTDLSAIVPGAPEGVRSYDWIIKSTSMSYLNIYNCTPVRKTKVCTDATFTGRGTIQAVDRLTGISYGVGGNYQFQVDVSDNREPGSLPTAPMDEYAIKVWSPAGTFYTSGDAYGAGGILLDPLDVTGGNIQVRGK